MIARRFKLAALSGGVVGAIVVALFGAMVPTPDDVGDPTQVRGRGRG